MPQLGIIGQPQLGTTYRPNLSDALPATFALLLSGLSNQVYLGQPLPLALPGAPECDLLVAADITSLALTDTIGSADLPIAVPSLISLVGYEVFHQWAVWDPTVNGLNIVVSNGGAARLGN